MYSANIVFSQFMANIPRYEFKRCVDRYKGNHRVRKFSCWDQFLCMAFAQLTSRPSLRSTVNVLLARYNKLYHMGFRCHISLSTLADANETRDWKIYADFAQVLINRARDICQKDKFEFDISETVYALDSSTIDLCLNLFPWAKFRKTKSAVKLHTLLDVMTHIPDFIEITDGKFHDVNILDVLIPEAGSFYIMDRAYNDFYRLYQLHILGAFFVIRAKTNMKYSRVYSHKIDKSTGLKCDQTIKLTGKETSNYYPEHLRRVRYFDSNKNRLFSFITNNFAHEALVITKLFKSRWQVELFFKWIKQHLRIKTFFGTSENAVKTQIWIAVCVYVYAAILKEQMNLNISLYTFLDILGTSAFDEADILQIVTRTENSTTFNDISNQLELFDF